MLIDAIADAAVATAAAMNVCEPSCTGMIVCRLDKTHY